jgi:hypothetical protein
MRRADARAAYASCGNALAACTLGDNGGHGFVADFYCPRPPVVEVDGPIHDERQSYDEDATPISRRAAAHPAVLER